MSDLNLNIYKIRFCFSFTWKAPAIPILGVDDDFISQRNSELKTCFSKINEKLLKIDVSSNEGYSDLQTCIHVVDQLRIYKFSINPTKSTSKAFVPYTASNKGRIG